MRKKNQENEQISYEGNPFEQTITFDKSLRGYKSVQVDDYVTELTKEYNQMYLELTNLKNEYQALKTRNDFFENNIDAISMALVKAEIVADEIAKKARGTTYG